MQHNPAGIHLTSAGRCSDNRSQLYTFSSPRSAAPLSVWLSVLASAGMDPYEKSRQQTKGRVVERILEGIAIRPSHHLGRGWSHIG